MCDNLIILPLDIKNELKFQIVNYKFHLFFKDTYMYIFIMNHRATECYRSIGGGKKIYI